MLKYVLAALMLAAPLHAEEFNFPAIPGNGKFSFDAGVGVSYSPSYPGADENDLGPWLTLRNAGFGERGKAELDGFAILPSFGYIGKRESDDDEPLTGLDDLSAAYELGVRANFGYGPLTSYVSARQGFGGHHGIRGEVGFRYRTDISDRLTMWSGLETEYGNAEFAGTYFGVSADEAATSGYGAYDPSGGFDKISAKFSLRYSLNEVTAVLGEVEYGRLIGDAADSPLVQDKAQPVLKLGISRNISLNF